MFSSSTSVDGRSIETGRFDVRSQVLDATLVLIITNEIFLAIWLMIKGFAVPKSP
jgi:hypothetical protein